MAQFVYRPYFILALAQLDTDMTTTAKFQSNPFCGFQGDMITRKIQNGGQQPYLLTEWIFVLYLHNKTLRETMWQSSETICLVVLEEIQENVYRLMNGQTDAGESSIRKALLDWTLSRRANKGILK